MRLRTEATTYVWPVAGFGPLKIATGRRRVCRDARCSGRRVGLGSLLYRVPLKVERSAKAVKRAGNSRWSGNLHEVAAREGRLRLPRIVSPPHCSEQWLILDATAGFQRPRHPCEHVDLYARLGLAATPPPSTSEIRAAYRARILQAHPDRAAAAQEGVRSSVHSSSESQAGSTARDDGTTAHELNEAWAVLGDDGSRRTYDAARRGTVAPTTLSAPRQSLTLGRCASRGQLS